MKRVESMDSLYYERFPLGSLWTNGYLFHDGKGTAFFVDPGGDVGEVLDCAARRQIAIKAVLLTHGHLDHFAGVEGLIPLVGDAIYIAEEDAFLLKAPSEEMQAALRMKSKGAQDFRTVSDGEVLSIGEFEIRVMATPGHTRGSVCYLIRHGDRTVLASGDTLFAQSVGRTDLPGGDDGELMLSLQKLAALPDALPVLPGHGPDTTIGRERKANPFWPRSIPDRN
jgi:glyoxylase-like metal-dependent hydrolase (beta-lactamase superfamily II)